MNRIFLLLLLALAPLPLFAHTTGTSLEKQVGDSFIDVGYNPPALSVGEPIRFDFNVRGPSTTEVPFSDIWVRLAQKDKDGIFFAGAIHKSSFGLSGMTIVFPVEGDYELTVRFENASGSIAEAAFPLSVAKDQNTKPSPLPLLAAGIGIVVGLLIGKKRRA